jgi:DNA-binding NarL/FixJ family response regulator
MTGGTLTERQELERAGSTPLSDDQRRTPGADDDGPWHGRPSAVLADPRSLARLAMREALAREGVAVVAEAADADAAVRAVRTQRPELCLVDARLPGAIAAVQQSVAASPRTRVVVMLESSTDPLLVEALRAGAAGCLLKSTGPEALGRTARATLKGEAPLPRSAARRVIDELRMLTSERRVRTASGSWAQLSRREAEVLELLRQDLSTGEIADRLGISAITVRRHVSGTLRRLGAQDRDAALRLADGQPSAERV